jgi:hypothetical protein
VSGTFCGKFGPSQLIAERHGALIVASDVALPRRVLRHDRQQLLAHLQNAGQILRPGRPKM